MTLSPENSRALGRPTWIDTLGLLILVASAGIVSILRGQDANWDLQNYHYYNPWAWWNGRIFDRDLAAAQLQTFHNPLLDLPFFAMVQWNWPPQAIAFVLAIPAGVGAFFLAKLLPHLFADVDARERRFAVASAFAIGVTSAMGIATLGTTMNEWPGAALVIAALWLVVREIARTQAGALAGRALALAGVLVGLATGAKLTAAMFAVGLCAAILLRTPRGPQGWRGNLREAVFFAAGTAIGILVTIGPWACVLWTRFDSPLFPYFNDWIGSPWWDATPLFRRVYGPHRLEGWLLFPFHLIGPGENFVTEVKYTDARFPVAWGLCVIAGAVWIAFRLGRRAISAPPRGVSAAWRIVGIFTVVSFLVWTAQHSIYRYLVPLDLLTGAVIVTLLQRLVRPGYLPAIACTAAIAIIATTKFGNWWHVDFGKQWFAVEGPSLPRNAMVLLTTGAPVAYVIPSLAGDARFVAVQNNINGPARDNRLAHAVNDSIRGHRGPLYQLTYPSGEGSDALARHGLARVESECELITTNMRTSPIELCPLTRRGDNP